MKIAPLQKIKKMVQTVTWIPTHGSYYWSVIHTIRNTSSYHKYHPKTNILNPENLMASYIDVTFIFLLWLFSGFKMLLPVSGGGGCKYPTDNRGISHPSDFKWFPLQVSRLAPLASNETDHAHFHGLKKQTNWQVDALYLYIYNVTIRIYVYTNMIKYVCI